jgi:hypothetical protein
VEHQVRLPAPQPWRSAALIATSVAAVELCVLVALGIVAFGKFFHGQVDRATDPAAVAQAAVAGKRTESARSGATQESGRKAMLARRETSVIVLNGNGLAGAAAIMADRVHARRYTIAGTDNAPRPIARSIVMYRPGFQREAERFAHDFDVGRVSPLDGLRIRQLRGAHVALLLGSR